MTPEQIKNTLEGILYRNDLFLKYYATNDEIPWGNIISSDRPIPEPSYMVSGINLSRDVLDKVFYENAVNWFPGIDKDYK